MRLTALRTRLLRLGGLLLVLLVALPASARELFIGMTRAELVATAGKPTSSLAKGDEEILLYPGGIRIEIRQGAVYRIAGTDDYAVSREAWLASQDGEVGLTPAEVAPSGEAPATLPSPSEPEPPPEPEPPTEPEPESGSEPSEAGTSGEATEGSGQLTPEQARQLFEAATAESATEAEAGPAWGQLLTGVLIQFFITLIVLFLTFKVLGVTAFIDALSLIALVDVLVKTGVEAGIHALGFPGTFYLDTLIALLVMLVLVQKTTAATTWPTAVKVVLTTQVVGILLGYLLFMVMLNSAFSF